MKKTIAKINSVLVDWNPIYLNIKISNEEYRDYIPNILRFVSNRDQLFCYLEDSMSNIMEVGDAPMSKEHSEDLQHARGKLIEAVKCPNYRSR